MKKILISFLTLVLLSWALISACTQKETEGYDLIIKHGKLIDGSGNPWYYADIGIRGDTIIKIGDLSGAEAERKIDAEGKIVAPGFIDMHTHCDWGLGTPETKANLNYLSQGVTTVVTGNCGHGRLEIAEIAALWKKQGIGTNAVQLAGFGTIRRAVLGNEDRSPTATELDRMKALLDQAMQEGAWGLSTGLQYIPDRYSTTEEIITLAKVAAAYSGIYSSHMRSEEEQLVEAVAETITIGRESGIRINTAHLKASGKNNWGSMQAAVELMQNAREQGIEMTADMYPYNKSATTPLQVIFNIPAAVEPFAEYEKKLRDENISDQEKQQIYAQYPAALAQALADPIRRKQIRQLTLAGDPQKVNWVAKGGWYNFTIMDSKKNPDLVGKMFCDLALESGRDEFDIAADLFIQEKNELIISLSAMSEDDVKYALQQEFVMISSDGAAIPFGSGGAHPRNYGSFTRVLRKYVREENLLPLAAAVRKMTSLPAQQLRLRKRGLLLVGYKADITIFDPQTVQDNATFLQPHQYSTGIDYVVVNGKVCISEGEFNNTYSGKALLLTKN